MMPQAEQLELEALRHTLKNECFSHIHPWQMNRFMERLDSIDIRQHDAIEKFARLILVFSRCDTEKKLNNFDVVKFLNNKFQDEKSDREIRDLLDTSTELFNIVELCLIKARNALVQSDYPDFHTQNDVRLADKGREIMERELQALSAPISMDDSVFMWTAFRELVHSDACDSENQNVIDQINRISAESLETTDGKRDLLEWAFILNKEIESLKTRGDIPREYKSKVSFLSKCRQGEMRPDRIQEKKESLKVEAGSCSNITSKGYVTFRDNLLKAGNYYLIGKTKSSALTPGQVDKGRLRAESLVAQLEAIDIANTLLEQQANPQDRNTAAKLRAQERELILLAACIVCPPENPKKPTVDISTGLRNAILTTTEWTEKGIGSFKEKMLISDAELLRRTNELNLIVSVSRRLEHDTRQNLESRHELLLQAVKNYITNKEEALKEKSVDDKKKDKGLARADHLQKALIDIKSVNCSFTELQRKLYELVYLIPLSYTMGSTHSDLKDRVLFAFGWKESELKELMTDEENASLFGDLIQGASGRAKKLFEKDIPEFPERTEIARSATQVVVDEQPLIIEEINSLLKFTRAVLTGIHNYIRDVLKLELDENDLARPFSALLPHLKVDGRRRANHLLLLLKKIQEQLESQSPPDASTFKKIKQELITLTCALVFKTTSTDLKKKILDAIEASPEQLKKEQVVAAVSDYAACEKAKIINAEVVALGWAELRDRIIEAVHAYRNSGLGHFKGKFRAERCLEDLAPLKNVNMDIHRNQYELIFLAYTVAIESKSTNLKAAIMDIARLPEGALENLKEQYGVSKKAITSKDNEFNGNPYQSLYDKDEFVLYAQLLRAATICFRTCANEYDRGVAFQLQRTLLEIRGRFLAIKIRSERDLIEVKFQLLSLANQVFNPGVKAPALLDEICISMGIGEDQRDETIEGRSVFERQIFKLNLSKLSWSEVHFCSITLSDKAKALFDLLALNNAQTSVADSTAASAVGSVDETKLKNLPAAFFTGLKVNLLTAAEKYLNDPSLDSSEGIRRATNLKNALNAIGNSEQSKKHLILLASTVMTGPGSKSADPRRHGEPIKLAVKAMIFTKLSESLVEALQKGFGISEIRDIVAAKLAGDASFSLSAEVVNWGQLKADLLARVNDYTPSTSMGAATKERLIAEIKSIQNEDLDFQRKLAVVVCAAVYTDSSAIMNCVQNAFSLSDRAALTNKVHQLQVEFLIGEADFTDMKKALTAPVQLGFFASSPTSLIPCPIDEGWVEFKNQLVRIVDARHKSLDAATTTPPGITFDIIRNLLLKLDEIDSSLPTNRDAQKLLLKLANVVFDTKFKLGIDVVVLPFSTERLKKSTAEAAITPFEISNFVSKSLSLKLSPENQDKWFRRAVRLQSDCAKELTPMHLTSQEFSQSHVDVHSALKDDGATVSQNSPGSPGW